MSVTSASRRRTAAALRVARVAKDLALRSLASSANCLAGGTECSVAACGNSCAMVRGDLCTASSLT
jgi:hypothetical protein